MRVLGLAPSNSYMEIDDGVLCVRMGWAFSLEAPLESVRNAQRDDARVTGWGVHGWRGRWLVNGSSSRLVRIELEPPARARTGPVPITVRQLRVSVEDPDGLLAALGGPASYR
jgi:hypothetical protein